MSVIYSDAAAQARHQGVISLIDAGSGPGVLKLGTSGMAEVLAVIPFAKPCGAAVGRQLVFDCVPFLVDLTADATGVALAAVIEDSDGNPIITGLTVGVSTGDIRMTTNALVEGQPVPITAGVITTPVSP